ncbi:TetR/AcrR family transcriptional regulator [Nonomuraea sp. NBC_01738]|uniref:TetR/AcrR family transcriptional regulator n=1 Tax=Nonomuraea sp. NBC_01738 TaxID=2976003 RepID=UPI002E1689DD|nr:TetR/AcrR family transcriptional regulator [Nonomuraea sp. NBC_01738]
MDEGLRERKKRETRQRIADMAMGLFMARGFDNVTVAEVARAADVSVNTVFNYFKTKEDLFLDRSAMVEVMPAEVVRERATGESVIAALRRDFLDALDTRHWRYGFGDGSDVFAKLVSDSPALTSAMLQMHMERERALAEALMEATDADPDDLRPWLVATQVLNTTRVLTAHAARRMMAGEDWARIGPDIREQAEIAFGLLERGVGDYGARSGAGQDEKPPSSAARPNSST